MIKAKRFCLMLFGVGLNVSPLVMKFIIDAVRSQQESVGRATSVYIVNVYVNENTMSVEHIRTQFAEYGLMGKDPERLKDGVRVLGLEVWGSVTLCNEHEEVRSLMSLIS